MRPLRVGIIGCGRIARSAHIPNYLRAGARVTAIADIDSNALKEVGERYDIEAKFLDYHELLEEDHIDAVSICTPPETHRDIAVEAARHRKHILCEKPIAATVGSAREMIDASRRAGVVLMVGHNLRFLPNHERAKELVKLNRIGRVLFARAQWVAEPQWPRDIGVLLDAGTHLADLLRWIFKEVEAVARIKANDSGVDSRGIVGLRFKGGVLGEISALYAPLEHMESMAGLRVVEIIGERGRIVSDLFGPSLRYYREGSLMCRLRGELTITPRFDPRNPTAALAYSYKREIEAFVRSALKGAPPPITGEDGLAALKIVLGEATISGVY